MDGPLMRLLTLKARLIIAALLAALGLSGFFLLSFIAAAGIPSTTQGAHSGISNEVPAEYRDDVLHAGGICPQITPSIIAAQIEAESGWNPHATSSAGAQGISQFMPATWATQGLDGDGDAKADILNPHDAIYSQGVHMCALHGNVEALITQGRISGDALSLTLAAYNAGLGAVISAGGMPTNAETSRYVPRILAAAERYSGTHTSAATLTGVAGNTKEALQWAIDTANDNRHQYVWGGAGPLHYDCSGFAQEYMRRRGITIPRVSTDQVRTGRPVSEANAKPGDLIFWSSDGGHFWHHTAIYLGGGQMVSADNPAAGINVEPIWGRNELLAFRTYD